MAFDPTTLDHATLVETNRRLNKRAQKWEHVARKYRRRYVAIQRPTEYAFARAEWYFKRMKELEEKSWREIHPRYDFFAGMKARIKRWIKQW